MTPSDADPADEVFDHAAAQYQGLVADLAAEFDLDTGLAVALQSQHYTELVEGLSTELDLDAGVDAALSTLGPLLGWEDLYEELPAEEAPEPSHPEAKLTEEYAEPSSAAIGRFLDDLRSLRNDVVYFRPSPVLNRRDVVTALDELSNGIATRSMSRDQASRKAQRAVRRWESGIRKVSGSQRASALTIGRKLQALSSRVEALFNDSDQPARSRRPR